MIILVPRSLWNGGIFPEENMLKFGYDFNHIQPLKVCKKHKTTRTFHIESSKNCSGGCGIISHYKFVSESKMHPSPDW